MVSLTTAVKQLAAKKQEISKIRRSSEKEFQKAKSVSRKYTSSLNSLQKRVVTSRQQIDEITQLLNQKMSQLESIQRLKKSAQDRLGTEIQNKEQLENEVGFSNTDDEKQNILSRISVVNGVIDDIKNEIKQRTPMEKKLTQIIDEINNSKSKISNTVKKNLESKPTLVNLVKTTTTKLEKTAKKYQSSKSLEDSAKTKLNKVTSDLSKLLKKRAKVKAKAKARAEARKAKAKPRKAKAKPRKAKAKPRKEYSGFGQIIGMIRNFLFERDVKRPMPKSDKAVLEKARRINEENEHERKVARAKHDIKMNNRYKGIDDNYDEDGEALIG